MTKTYQIVLGMDGKVASGILCNEIGFIPDAPNNTDWQEYQRWLAEGNTPNPYVPPPAPPPLTAAEKLEAAGLTVDELKELLGL